MSLAKIISARGIDTKTISRLAQINIEGRDLDVDDLSTGEKRRLAEILGVDETLLFADVDVELTKIPEDFRTERNDPALITKNLLSSIYRSYEIIDFISTLKPYTNKEKRSKLDKLKVGSLKQKEILASLKSIFGGDGAEFASHKSPYKLFLYLRYKIEEAGAIVICERSKDHTFKGFCVSDRGENLIYINIERQNYESRIFTLVHEAVHLLSGNPGIVNPALPRLGVERFCNKVTSEFLLPNEFFRSAFSELSEAQKDIVIVGELADRLPFSRYFLAIRAEEVFPNLKGLTNDWLQSIGVTQRVGTRGRLLGLSEDVDAEDDVDIESEGYVPRHTRASFQVARLGFSVLSFAEALSHTNMVNRHDLSSYLKIPARDQAKIFESMRRKQQEASGYGSI